MSNRMATGVCPKCDSHEVYVSKPGSQAESTGFSIDWRTGVIVRRYICLRCFYVETYAPMTDAQKDRIREKWLRVSDAYEMPPAPRKKLTPRRKRKRKNDES